MIKIIHIITSLSPAGGAEIMLSRLACGMDKTRFDNEVISLAASGDLGEKMKAAGVPVQTLGMKGNLPNPLLLIRLASWIRRSKPDVIQTWMYHANLIGSLAAHLAGHVPVVWAIHNSALDSRVNKRRTMLVNRVCKYFSSTIPARIICCSEATQLIHKEYGYAPEKLQVIPNGFDLEQLKPDAIERASVRKELGISIDTLLIGTAARFHPQKDHRNFIQAAARLHAKMPQVHFLLCGAGITWQNSQLAAWIEAAGIRECCHLLGPRQDMPRLFAAMDIATTSSVCGEAFPMVIGEAMSCGVPCVVTDIGDSALIVGTTGRVVPTGDADALAKAWRDLVEASPELRRRLGMAARDRIQQNFALSKVLDNYQAVYTQLSTETGQSIPLSVPSRQFTSEKISNK